MSSIDTDNKSPNTSKPSSNFIRQKIGRDLETGKHGGRVQTRFPPEPNGYLHIGHAKSICLNFSLAEEFGGHCNLRFDDTNPEKESLEFVAAIMDNIKWLGFSWQGQERYSSSYFDPLYDFAVQLIKNDKAYACPLSAEQAREYRGTLTEPGRNSPGREHSITENLQRFADMKAGKYKDGEYSLRAKIDMASPNVNMRDPVLYRIRHISHHQTGDQWCIYPTYDYTHCISDAIENITHSLCTLEFEDHRPLYDWILHSLDIESLRAASDLGASADYVLPEQTEFAKLKINYTLMGKRKLKEMVESGVVESWDDPRMPTLAGMRRRGFTPAAIRNFCESIGVARSEGVVEMGMLEHAIRTDLDENAPRVMGVLNPLKITLKNLEKGHVEHLSLSRHPKNEAMGRRDVPFTQTLYIDHSDFEEVAPPGFKRLVSGGEVRLRGAYVIKCEQVLKNDEGEILELICTVDQDTLGKKPEGRKVKGVIHWVSADLGLPVRVRLYDRLFTIENPEAKDIADYRDHLNPQSLVELDQCVVEPSVKTAATDANGEKVTRYQFEREGYFCIDEKDSGDDMLIFNRTITLRDSWTK